MSNENKNPEVNLEEIRIKLIERLRPSGWADKLKGFLMSSDFATIINHLYKEREDGKRFTPPLKDVFSAFENCPYDSLQVVIVGQDPYYQLGVADGMAFSCSKTMEFQASLKYIIKEIGETVYAPEGYMVPDPDLTRWANQGVLLLNSALTTEIGKAGAHASIWQPFTNYLLDILNTYNSGLVFIFMGKRAQEFEDIIGKNHHKLMTSHPASAAYAKQDSWDSENVFSRTNSILKDITKNEIKW